MLDFDVRVPDEAPTAAPLIVLLHGRGSDKDDLMGLAPHLPAEAVIVAPRAPFPAAPWGYGSGWAWYRYLGENRPEPESFSESLRHLENFLDELPKRLSMAIGTLVLGGFSQGGTLSLGYALSRPNRRPPVLNFSGFLADHPQVRAAPETAEGLAVFWGHGTRDPNIPFTYARQGRAELRQAGARVEARDYDIGHWIDPAELSDAVRWLRQDAGLILAAG